MLVFYAKVGKLGKNALIVVDENWNYSGLGWWISSYSKIAVQVGVGASLKHDIDVLALGEPFLYVKIAQITV